MGLYMYQAAYTAESLAAQMKEPQDRVEAVRSAVEAMGIKIIAGGYPFGKYDVLFADHGDGCHQEGTCHACCNDW
jgi:uncharacterized protein with GYD domain